MGIQRKRSETFFYELFTANYSRMEAYAFRILKSREAAQEAVQEAFLIAYQKLEVVQEMDAPVAWLYTTLRNVICNTYRKQMQIKKLYVAMENEKEESQSMALDIHLLYAGTVSRDELQLLIWVYCEGWSYQEAADALQISLAACKKRIQRAKIRMKEVLENEKF